MATTDWDEKAGQDSSKSLVKRLLNECAGEGHWVPESWIINANKKGVDFHALKGVPEMELREYAPPDPIDEVKAEVVAAARDVFFASLASGLEQKMLANDNLWNLVGDGAAQQIHSTTTVELRLRFQEVLKASDAFRTIVTKEFLTSLRKATKQSSETPFLDSIQK